MTVATRVKHDAERSLQTAYRLGHVTYLPHYLFRDRFVGPGFPRRRGKLWTSTELVALGAVPIKCWLFVRGGFDTEAQPEGDA